MIYALAAAERNIKTAVSERRNIKKIFRKHDKGCDLMIEFDEYRLKLSGMEKSIIELRDSL